MSWLTSSFSNNGREYLAVGSMSVFNLDETCSLDLLKKKCIVNAAATITIAASRIGNV